MSMIISMFSMIMIDHHHDNRTMIWSLTSWSAPLLKIISIWLLALINTAASPWNNVNQICDDDDDGNHSCDNHNHYHASLIWSSNAFAVLDWLLSVSATANILICSDDYAGNNDGGDDGDDGDDNDGEDDADGWSPT